MSQHNPVPPQAPYGGGQVPGQPAGQGGFGPAAPGGQGGFGPAPAQGGFGPAPGSPASPSPASPHGNPPEAPPPFPGPSPDAAAPKKKGGIGKKVLGVVGAIVVGLGIFGVKAVFNNMSDDTRDAKAGDCIADANAPAAGGGTAESDAEVVDCTSAEAKYTVVGRVEGKTEAQFEADNELKMCSEAGFQAEYMIWSGRRGGSGYILCLNEKK